MARSFLTCPLVGKGFPVELIALEMHPVYPGKNLFQGNWFPQPRGMITGKELEVVTLHDAFWRSRRWGVEYSWNSLSPSSAKC